MFTNIPPGPKYKYLHKQKYSLLVCLPGEFWRLFGSPRSSSSSVKSRLLHTTTAVVQHKSCQRVVIYRQSNKPIGHSFKCLAHFFHEFRRFNSYAFAINLFYCCCSTGVTLTLSPTIGGLFMFCCLLVAVNYNWSINFS